MQNDKGRQHKNLLDFVRHSLTLSCLLAFSLLCSLLPTALSSQTQSSIISTKGSLTYSLNAALLVTDSTLEGSIPYKIDGNSGYQTGSTYAITVGVHTIELPSPYTSPISSLTYYFLHWQDGSTDNPRTVTLEASVTYSLHGVYSNPPEPPLPPPSGMPSDFLAYSGFESPTTTSNVWEINNGLSWGWVSSAGSSRYMDSSNPYLGSRSLRMVKPSGVERHCLTIFKNSKWANTIYTSGWYKINAYSSFTWSVPWVFRNNYLGNQEIITIQITAPYVGGTPFWWMFHSHGPGASGKIDYWSARIYQDYTSEWTTQGTIMANAHEVPIGRWFRLEVYMHRDRWDGYFQVWITDPQNPDPSRRNMRVLMSAEGVRNADQDPPQSVSTNYVCPLAKLYGGDGGYSLYGDWNIDELYIYDYNAHQ